MLFIIGIKVLVLFGVRDEISAAELIFSTESKVFQVVVITLILSCDNIIDLRHCRLQGIDERLELFSFLLRGFILDFIFDDMC